MNIYEEEVGNIEREPLSEEIVRALESALMEQEPVAAIDKMNELLRNRGEYHNLFYGLLLKKRFQLGLPLLNPSPPKDLPDDLQLAYEEGIREAAREVGNQFLGAGDIGNAFAYFRMIGEMAPVITAIDNFAPDESTDLEPIVNIAFHQGIHPKRGFDLILEQFGICSAVTTMSSQEFPHGEDAKQYCIQRLVRALYQELQGRLIADIEQQEEKKIPAGTPVKELISGRFYLFGENIYHVDVSHLSSIVQLASQLQSCPEIGLARELCAYGENLSDTFQMQTDPPFDKLYKDFGVYLSILDGEKVDEGLEYFRTKLANIDMDEYGTYPIEIFVNLLLRVNREEEALELASKHLADVTSRPLSCPGLVELCERTGRYQTLSDLAKKHGDLVHYLTGRLATMAKST